MKTSMTVKKTTKFRLRKVADQIALGKRMSDDSALQIILDYIEGQLNKEVV